QQVDGDWRSFSPFLNYSMSVDEQGAHLLFACSTASIPNLGDMVENQEIQKEGTYTYLQGFPPENLDAQPETVEASFKIKLTDDELHIQIIEKDSQIDLGNYSYERGEREVFICG